jgi:hypothetical protein
MKVTVNDCETFGAMAEGVEFVSNLITRYAIIEKIYLQHNSEARLQLTAAVVQLYAAVLTYLGRAGPYYARRTGGMPASSMYEL